MQLKNCFRFNSNVGEICKWKSGCILDRCYQHVLTGHVRFASKAVSTSDHMNIFDKNAKLYQKERAAISPDVELYDYLKDNVGYVLSDRLYDIKRKFNIVVDLGCGRGHVSKHIQKDCVSEVIMCDSSPTTLEQAKTPADGVNVKKLVVNEEEKLPFDDNSIDLFISSLSLHWVNNLPGLFSQIMSCLKNDGIFLAALFGGETLFELRSSLHLAQMEREGGVSSHISPFTEIRDIGSLLTTAGYSMLTIDTEEIVVSYPSMFELMWDLKGMGENNAARNRATHLRKETLLSAAAIYENMYGSEEKIPATFQIIYFIGWKPDPSQPKPIQRGSAQFSLKDLHKLDEIIEKSGRVELDEPEK